MPTYEYGCKSGHQWDVIKTVSAIDDPELCPDCRATGDRRISRTNFTGASDWNNQTYNPALGCYTKSTADARKIAKSRGYEEIGTEKPESIHKAMDKTRQDNRDRRWAEADREKLYE